jgi:GT2 family glycosyltransferase
MRLSTCITTRNRPQELEACLQSLWNSQVKPDLAIVSDDSPDNEIQQKNYLIVQQYPQTIYLTGPRLGVCANRNRAVNATPIDEIDLVAFIDDDICVESDFIGLAIKRYEKMSPEQRLKTILSGISKDPFGGESFPAKLSFRGYFSPSDIPEAVSLHAAVFPRVLFEVEQWDENIFFGYEDAELCLRALRCGNQILHCPELKTLNTCYKMGTLSTFSGVARLTDYEIYIEAARLYVGIKRYYSLFPSPPKLLLFVIVYFSHMTTYLLKRRSLSAFPEIWRRSHIERLQQQSKPPTP